MVTVPEAAEGEPDMAGPGVESFDPALPPWRPVPEPACAPAPGFPCAYAVPVKARANAATASSLVTITASSVAVSERF
ncbi:hypothetical protein F6X40_17500 [Paraburkholderia sp. UCT31]|nr:hypothetical protein [Paraburkholderia sp. UCT31]